MKVFYFPRSFHICFRENFHSIIIVTFERISSYIHLQGFNIYNGNFETKKIQNDSHMGVIRKRTREFSCTQPPSMVQKVDQCTLRKDKISKKLINNLEGENNMVPIEWVNTFFSMKNPNNTLSTNHDNSTPFCIYELRCIFFQITLIFANTLTPKNHTISFIRLSSKFGV